MADSVEAFLEQSREPGTAHREGSFTVDIRKSLEKLERFRLADTGGYLLKVVQAAVCLDSSLLLVTINYHCVEVEFNFFYDESVSAEVLGECLTGQVHWASPACRHLGLALRAGLGAGHTRVTWQLGPEHRLSLGAEGATCVSRPERGIVRATVSFERGASRVKASDEHEVLYRKCILAPCEIRVDTRPVERGWAPPSVSNQWYQQLSEPYRLMEGYEAPSQVLPGFLFPQVDLRASRRRGEIWRSKNFQRWGKGYRRGQAPEAEVPTFFHRLPSKPPSTSRRRPIDLECGAAFSLPLQLDGSTRVFFLLDGVLGPPVLVNFGCPGLNCIVSGQGLETDISEFGLLENDLYRERMRALEAAAKEFVETARAHLEHYLPITTVTHGWLTDEVRFQNHIKEQLKWKSSK